MHFPKKRTKCLGFIVLNLVVFYIPLNVLSFLSAGEWKKKYYLRSNRGLHEIPGNASERMNRSIEILLNMDLNAKSDNAMSDSALIDRILHSVKAKLKDLGITLHIQTRFVNSCRFNTDCLL